MLSYEKTITEKEWKNPRQTDWRFKLMLHFIGLAFHAKFNKLLIVTCLGRGYNPKSAHYSLDKLTCAADIQSWEDGSDPYLTVEELTWLANLNVFTKPYMDILIEDERITGKKPDGGNHVHVEFNPGYWIKF